MIERVILLGCFLLLSTSVFAQLAQPQKLNSGITENVWSYQLSPDNKNVIFRTISSSPSTSSKFSLYSVPISGGTPIKISEHTNSGYFVISPDGKTVVFSVSKGNNSGYELYSVPVSGGTPTQISDLLGSRHFSIVPDGSRVVFLSEERTAFASKYIYSASINGDSLVKLNKDIPDLGGISLFEISADNESVIFNMDRLDGNFSHLYRYSMSNDKTTKLFSPATNNIVLSGYEIDSKSQHVIFRTTERGSDPVVYQIFSVALSDSNIKSLSGPIKVDDKYKATLGQFYKGFRVNNESEHVVFQADKNSDSKNELYSVPITGGSPQILNSSTINDDVFFFDISNGGEYVLYSTVGIDNNLTLAKNLYSVPIIGGIPKRLNKPLNSQETISFFQHPNSRGEVIFSTNNANDNSSFDFYSSTLSGEVLTKFISKKPVSGKLHSTAVISNSSKFIFLTLNSDNLIEIYESSLLDKKIAKLNVAPFSKDYFYYIVTSDGSYFTFMDNPNINDEVNLYSIDLNFKNDDFCIPIKTASKKFALVCL